MVGGNFNKSGSVAVHGGCALFKLPKILLAEAGAKQASPSHPSFQPLGEKRFTVHVIRELRGC